MSIAFGWISVASVVTPYIEIVGQMVFLGVGLGCTTAPATESIMGSLSVDKAGVGSAVNDTTRELGGTLGVAILGSIFSSLYVTSLDSALVTSTLPAEAREAISESVGAAPVVAAELGVAAPAFLAEVNAAFLDGLAVACYAAAGITLAGAVFVVRFLPARAQ